MNAAANEPTAPREPAEVPGYALAVAAEALYLANLLILPGLACAALCLLCLRHRHTAPALARNHLRQTFSASLWAAALLVAANLVILFLGGYRSPHTWVVLILYFTTCHSALVCFGALGLARALAGRNYVYPLIGARE
ncbi:MAG: hypothetical protein KF778_09755 [Rhodocyclaceae bacterium]|nr:hypothetical protein [Rhodocyclaceae bacterium]MBX3668674.1 hypothetical protein [Rhodocyclaceae bacterium]